MVRRVSLDSTMLEIGHQDGGEVMNENGVIRFMWRDRNSPLLTLNGNNWPVIFKQNSQPPCNVVFRNCILESPLTILGKIIWSDGQTTLPEELTLEMMRWDALLHGDAKAFNKWKQTHQCPYGSSTIKRALRFDEDGRLWRPGKPKLNARELLQTLFKHFNCKVYRGNKRII